MTQETNIELNKETILSVISKLPHSESRVPYTYHHDYLRVHSPAHYGMDRSEVAQKHYSDETELYAIALCSILESTDTMIVINSLDVNDLQLCKLADNVTKNVIHDYNLV